MSLLFHSRSKLVNDTKNLPFSPSTDGSSNQVLIKMNPLLIRIFDPTKGSISPQLLDMCTCKESTSEALFEMINQTLSQFGISWKNCVAMLLDNTSVNLGKKNSIIKNLQR